MEDLQRYAHNFLFLPHFEELANGTSVLEWTCFVTLQPVLCLGVVEAFVSSAQQAAMCSHLDTYQPA